MKNLDKYIYYRCYDFLLILKSHDIHFAALHLLSLISSAAISLLLFTVGIFPASFMRKYIYIGVLTYLIPLVFFYFLGIQSI